MSWLDDLVKEHSEFESPLSFWKWSALSAISAIVKDQIWLPRYLYKLYPNIYVMLHAESGLKKGPPVSMANQLVSSVNNTRVISGRSSIQAILKEMGTSHTIPGGKVISTSTAFICSSELSSSIVDDPVAAKILTDLYDRHYRVSDWRSLLKMETFNLKDPTITMLTATNDAMSQSFFDKSAIQGGFFARTFIIYENEENKANALIIPPKWIPDYQKSSEYLKTLSQLKGSFTPMGSSDKDELHTIWFKSKDEQGYLTEAGLVYQEWYNNFKKTIKEQGIKDSTGTLNRFGDSVLKVAMLLSLSEKSDLIINEQAMIEAIDICEKLIGNVRRATMSRSGMSDSSTIKNHIIHELLGRETHRISRQLLMKKMWMHFSSADEFDEIMLSFDQSNMIKILSVGNQIIYEMMPDQVQELQRFLAGKNQ